MHDHSRHHNEEMIKNLIQAEAHLQKEFCPECLSKHLLGAEAYMEEEVLTNENAEKKLIELAQRVRNIRREIMEINKMKHENYKKKLESST